MKRSWTRPFVVAFASTLFGCSTPAGAPADSAVDRIEPAPDAIDPRDGSIDVSIDGSIPDVASFDGSTTDGSTTDGSTLDAPILDAPNPDVTSFDARESDTRGTDSGASDAGTVRPSAGCGRAASAGVSNGAIMVGGVRRTYVLSVPSGYDPAIATPIVFGWHGNTWTGATFRPSIAVETNTARPTIFVYPDGLDVAGLPPEAAGGVTGTGWDWRRDGRDVALFDALLAELEGRFCIDTTRRFSFGRSHGGFFAHALACARGDRLRASAAVSAGAPAWVLSTSCATAVPSWMAHNADDRTVPVALAYQARDRWLDTNGCAMSTGADGPCALYPCARADTQFCLSATGDHAPPAFAGPRIAAWFAAR